MGFKRPEVRILSPRPKALIFSELFLFIFFFLRVIITKNTSSTTPSANLMFLLDTFFPQCYASCLLPLNNDHLLCFYFAGKHEKASDVGSWLKEYCHLQRYSPRLIAKINAESHWNPVIFATSDGIRVVFLKQEMKVRTGAHTRSFPKPTVVHGVCLLFLMTIHKAVLCARNLFVYQAANCLPPIQMKTAHGCLA